jgi:hypothetical protein
MPSSTGMLFAAFASVLLGGCAPADGPETAANDGRKRLNANVSYADFGDYVVHVSALTSDTLTPDIAQTYGIARSEDLGIINLVVLRKSDEPGADRPVAAQVGLTAANLTGQTKNVDLQEIREGDSIYQIGTVTVENRETINFDFDVRPEGSDRNLAVRFTHEFYTR